MRRLSILMAVFFFSAQVLCAQSVHGPFSFADSLMRFSRIGRAGREHLKAVQIKPSVWSPAPYNPALPAVYASAEQGFVLYLLDRGLREDALVLLSRPNLVPSDTLSYLRGLSLFDDLQLEAADSWLSRSALEPALFYDVVAKAHLGRTKEAMSLLSGYSGSQGELACLQKAGLKLLQSDVASYRDISSSFKYIDANLSESERALDGVASQLASHRAKSPFAAAVFSTLLPGAGQLYAGSTGEALASFLTVGALGAVTAASWHKYGVKSWRTLVPASVCSLFYIGNIYGAYISVGIHEKEFKDETSAMVLYHIHIPIRGIYR